MDWTALATQIPLVAAFIWFALEMYKRSVQQTEAFMAALDKRDTEYEQRNQALVSAITELTRQITQQTERFCVHDEVTRSALAAHDKRVDERITAAAATTSAAIRRIGKAKGTP